MTRHILAVDAWNSLIGSEKSKWASNISRFEDPVAFTAHSPKFRIANDDSFFCIGSCFARNVEEHLIYRRRHVLSKKIICPASEWPYRVNGFVNKFTTASMLNELQWVLNPSSPDERMFEETPRGWLDLQLCPGVNPVSLDRAIERRTYLTREYFDRLRCSTVVIITLGLNEVWHDIKARRHLNAAPSFYSVRREPERYSVDVTDVAANVEALEAIADCIRQLNSSAKIIVTVSPVPMDCTFSGRDVAVANMLSKSTLRVAAETFADNHSHVDYFPSYDMICLSPRAQAYGLDCLHVSDYAVAQVIGHFLELYLGESIAPEDFNELSYLAANPEVEVDVRLGRWESGFEHWTQCGKNEGRRLAPEGGPTPLMITAGVV